MWGRQALNSKPASEVGTSQQVRRYLITVHRGIFFLRHIEHYYSFKIFPRFGLVETTRIIHHNQLLFTKFGKNLRHIQSMTSKVQPAADYSTVDRKNLGTRLWFWWAEKQRAKRRNSIKNGEIFWMNHKAIIEFGFRRIWRILQISESVIHLGG